MENLIRKSLNKREKCFSNEVCPLWLLKILPNRLKTVELINHDNENEQQLKDIIDLYPYELINRIPLINEKTFEKSYLSTFEYPNDFSFEIEELKNSFQFLSSPSNNQLLNLFKKFQEFKQKINENILLNQTKKQNQCQKQNCFNQAIPLSFFCKIHLFNENSKQILFDKCSFCQQICLREDEKNFLHFCSKY